MPFLRDFCQNPIGMLTEEAELFDNRGRSKFIKGLNDR
jgi:hypothetical protein